MGSKQMDLGKLVELIKGIDIAMLTTRAKDGRMLSRPLRTQQVEADGDLWFITSRSSHKAEDIRANPQVNVSYASHSGNTYVSVAGKACLVFDKAKIHELWSPAMAIFYPLGEDDPDLCLLKVEVESAEYWDGPGGFLGKALYLVAAAVTQDPGVLSDNEKMRVGLK